MHELSATFYVILRKSLFWPPGHPWVLPSPRWGSVVGGRAHGFKGFKMPIQAQFFPRACQAGSIWPTYSNGLGLGCPQCSCTGAAPRATTTGDPRDGPRWSVTLLMVVLKNACSYTPRSLSIWRCLQPTEENVMKSRSAKGFG